MHNAQVTAAHVRVSQALQRALLPRALPVVPGLDLAAQYLPASTGSDVGGDFYDVYPVGPAQWLVAIGDVCGTGAGAAARTGLMRDVLRVLVREGRPLVRAIELLNDVMLESGDPLQFATLAAALVTLRDAGDSSDTGTRELEVQLVLAGHLQPLLVRPDGRVDLLGVHGTAVGLVERLDLTCTSHVLRRRRDPAALHRRRHRAAPWRRAVRRRAAPAGRGRGRGPAGRAAATVVLAALDRFTAEAHDDDIALLALRASRRRDGGAAAGRARATAARRAVGAAASRSPPRAPSPSTRSRCPRLPCSPGSSAPPRWRCSASPRGGWRGR